MIIIKKEMFQFRKTNPDCVFCSEHNVQICRVFPRTSHQLPFNGLPQMGKAKQACDAELNST